MWSGSVAVTESQLQCSDRVQGLKAACTPRVAGVLTGQATAGQNMPHQAATRAREPPSASFHFLASLRLLRNRSSSAAPPSPLTAQARASSLDCHHRSFTIFSLAVLGKAAAPRTGSPEFCRRAPSPWPHSFRPPCVALARALAS